MTATPSFLSRRVTQQISPAFTQADLAVVVVTMSVGDRLLPLRTTTEVLEDSAPPNLGVRQAKPIRAREQ